MRSIHRFFGFVAPAACALVVVSSSVSASTRGELKDVPTPVTSRGDGPADHKGKDEPVRVRTSSPRAAASNGARHDTVRVNINTADVKELMTLSGVGRKAAEKIVEYRDAHGPFKKSDELRKVDGVGAGILEKNRDRIVTK